MGRLYLSFDFGVGVVLGFFGALLLFVSWVIFPIIGVTFLHAKRNIPFNYRSRYRFNWRTDWMTILFVSLGILFGGTPYWSIIILSFKNPPIYHYFISTGLFLAGAFAYEIFYFFSQRKKEKMKDKKMKMVA